VYLLKSVSILIFLGKQVPLLKLLERVMGFEPTTSCLGSKHPFIGLCPAKWYVVGAILLAKSGRSKHSFQIAY